MRYASITDRLAHLGSGRWAVHTTARRMKAAGEDIIELTIGEPDVAPDKALLDEAARAMYAGRTRYSNGRGEPGVLKALVDKYSARRAHMPGSVTEKNFLCFPGTQTALSVVMAGLVEKGDGVLVGDPLYATYEASSPPPAPISFPCRCGRRRNSIFRQRISPARSRRKPACFC